MSLPAAPAPLAVLVLAWDETTPAVRAVVEATQADAQALDSVVVVVPAGPDSDEATTQEEFLPLDVVAAGPTLLPRPASELPPDTAAAIVETTATTIGHLATESSAAVPDAALQGNAATRPLVANTLLASDEHLLPKAKATTFASSPPPAWAVVRVLRLSDFSLPALAERTRQALPGLVWRGSDAVPAAPYLGSSEIRALNLLANQLTEQPYLAQQTISATELLLLPPAPSTVAASANNVTTPTLATLNGALPVREPAPTSAASIAAPHPEQPSLLLPAEEELPVEGDILLPEDEEPLTTLFTPAQASWPDALDALRQPMPAEPVVATLPANLLAAPTSLPTGPPPAALLPPAKPFEAPNLNFQIIQYARFAVPLALAEAPYAVIYAPAWPTWLAAQELRRRTGQPLVLHVSTLAAPADDSLELAAGWQAELQRQALHAADVILAETPALAQRLRHELGLAAHTVRVVPAADAAAVAQALAATQRVAGH